MKYDATLERCAILPPRTKDGKAHDPIGTIGRARQTLHRLRTLKDAPPEWFNGTLDEYRSEVERSIFDEYPVLKGEPVPEAEPATLSADYFALSGGREFSKSGKRWRKDVLRVGEFHLPGAKSPVTFDAERLANLCKNTNALIAKGVKVPVPLRHSDDPAANVGFVPLLEMKDGELNALFDIEDESIRPKIGKTLTDVSVRIAPNYKASDGTVFDEVIDHICITSYPVVNDQKNFEPAALGLDRGGPGLYVEKRTVDPLASLKKKLSLSADATESDVEKALEAFEKKAADEKAELERKLADSSKDKTSLEARVAAVESTNAKLEAERIDAEVKDALDKFAITKAQEPAYRALLSARGTIALSKDGGKVEEKPIAELVREFVGKGAFTDLSRRITPILPASKEELERKNEATQKRASALERVMSDYKAEFKTLPDGSLDFEMVPRHSNSTNGANGSVRA